MISYWRGGGALALAKIDSAGLSAMYYFVLDSSQRIG
jgi:hypothetical protein